MLNYFLAGFLFVSIYSNSQDTLRRYYDVFDNLCSPDSAYKYVEWVPLYSVWSRFGYYLPTKRIWFRETLIDDKAVEAEYFHPNGQLHYRLTYDNGEIRGQIEKFYPNGNELF